MNDLISTLADQLLALINSKPQSPSKAEIEGLIRAPLTTLVDDHHHRSHPLFFVGPDGPPLEVKWSAPNDFTNWNLPTDLNEESFARAVAKIQNVTRTNQLATCHCTTIVCGCGARKP